MASQINPNDIDGAYPVAGQDNNSQGFRDNFTNTKTNFTYAANEITDLQTNVVLKAALSGTTLDNNMGGSAISDAVIRDFACTRVAIGTVSGSQTVNYASGHYQTLTTSGSVTLAFTNFPTSGNQAFLIVRVTVSSTAHTLTLPAAVGTSASATSVEGIQGISSNVITFNETGTYEFQFHTEDGGTSIYLSELTRPRNRFVNPLFLTGSEDLASTAAANVRLTTSYFSTAAAETATLAAGTDGQVKVFAMAADSGDMVITVTNAGWKASGTGTITFDTIGAACTLLYTNSKWYVIGNNGVTFA
jgi:hypothetical protein